MDTFRSILEPLIGDVSPTEEQWQLLQHHYDLLRRWNEKMNLSAIRDPEEIVERHFAESLLLLPFLSGAPRVIDIGSGGGFPGLPLAVLSPEKKFILLDSHSRKCVFLREASRPVRNVSVMNERLESLQPSTRYELGVARGVAWEHMFRFLPRITERLVLLSSEEELAGILKAPGYSWDEPIPLPSSKQRLIVTGTVLQRD